jgi:uncharacterized protein (DUF2141 family)
VAVIWFSSLANQLTGASNMSSFKSIFTAIAMTGVTFSAAAIAQDHTANLALSFTGIEEQQGAVMGVLFDSEDSFNGKGAPARMIMVTADKAEVATQFAGLKPGRYAIKAFHDIDGDGKMGTNPFGMPIEPFAFSNNAVGNMGPAKWADAAFEIKAGDNAHSIEIK